MSFMKNATTPPVNPQLRKSAEPNTIVTQKNAQNPAKQPVAPPRPFSPPVDKNKSSSETRPISSNPVSTFIISTILVIHFVVNSIRNFDST